MARFFHVARVHEQLHAGQVLGLRSVPFQTATADELPHLRSFLGEGISEHGFRYLVARRSEPPKTDTNGMLEMLAEYLRRAEYSDRLSRFRAFFAVRQREDADRFAKEYPPERTAREAPPPAEVWEVEGEMAFETDMRRLELGATWLTALSNLHAYWQGIPTNEPLFEVLLRMPVTVIARVNDL